jgi:hypothetical protein
MGLGVDGKDAAGADEDEVPVEAVALEVVQDLVATLAAVFVEELADGDFTVEAETKAPGRASAPRMRG